MLVPIAVKEIMRTPVETVTPEVTARQAASRLFERGIGSLVVCADEEPVGIVTDVDVTQLVSEGRDPEATTVGEFMASPLITTSASAALEDAAQTMMDHDIKRLPVVEAGQVVGIITTTDLANFLPHMVQRGRRQSPAASRERKSVRVDTAYENEDWEFEYLGSEAQIDVGDTVRFSKTLTEEDVEAFAEVSGDTNRLHLDAEYAAGTRFGERIVHGSLAGATISAALARLPGLIIYLSQDVSYLGPVPIGDRITAECEVVENMGKGRFRLSTMVLDEAGETVIDGEAVVISDQVPESA